MAETSTVYLPVWKIFYIFFQACQKFFLIKVRHRLRISYCTGNWRCSVINVVHIEVWGMLWGGFKIVVSISNKLNALFGDRQMSVTIFQQIIVWFWAGMYIMWKSTIHSVYNFKIHIFVQCTAVLKYIFLYAKESWLV